MRTPANLTAAAVAAACLLLAGCLVGETTHTLYLDPDGAVRWSVLERHIRSDEDDPSKRRSEEEDYLAAALDGQHPVARALDLLAPSGWASEVVRGRRPFTVLTEADYPSAVSLARSLFDGLDLHAEAWLEHEAGRTRFVLVVDTSHEPQQDNQQEDLEALLGDREDYRIHLTSGRFVDAMGFDIQGQGDVAVPLEVEPDDSGRVVYSLTWAAK